MNWRGVIITLVLFGLLFLVMFRTGMFMHGD